jgi:predicted nucleic acid-binding protein
LDEIAAMNRDLPALPNEAFNRENLYEERFWMTYLADTNIITRRILPADPLHSVVSAALLTLDQQGETVYITPQNLIDFQALATRPVTANGLGMTPAQASAEASRIEAVYQLLPDVPAIYPLWRNLVDTYSVVGRQVYNARLAAVMQAHGVTHLLTLDPTDFRRYAAVITVVEPHNVR